MSSGLEKYHENLRELLRHVATLSTACVLVLSALAERLGSNAKGRDFLLGALISYLVAIGAAVLAQVMSLWSVRPVIHGDTRERPESRLRSRVVALATSCFWLGLLLTTLLALENALP